MKISLQLFARARDLAGTSPITLELPDDATVDSLRHVLLTDYPQLEALRESLLWAVNHDYVTGQHPISPQDSVACFPPVSGG